NFELPLALGTAEKLPDADAIRAAFFAEHERAYGFHNPADPVEIVNFRLVAVGRLAQPEARPAPPGAAGLPAPTERRPVWFEAEAAVDTPVYDRARLAPGHVVAGPAVIEQLDATILLFPGDRGTVDVHLNLIVELAP
ncbi:MAG: hydantoinase/oxoprolinase family protein, partial [bacterium]